MIIYDEKAKVADQTRLHINAPSAATLAYPFNANSRHVMTILERGEEVNTYFINVLGIEESKIETLANSLRTELDHRSLVPIFLTDVVDFTVFRKADLVFEALPPLEANSAILPDMDWRLRRRVQIHLLRRKWKPVGELLLGEEII